MAKRVKLWVAMSCSYPNGREYNSMWDAESSRIALENWPTGPVRLPFADRVKYAQFLHDKSELVVGLDEATGRTGVLNIPLDKPPVEIPVVELTLR